MKLGILLAGRRPDDIRQKLEQARDAGFFLCQLNLTQSGYTRADLVAIADAMDTLGVRAVAIGCYVNPLRPDEPFAMGATRADLDLVLQSLDILGARRVVLCGGTHAETPFEPNDDNNSDESLEQLRTFVIDVCSHTKARHYYLLLEPFHMHVLHSEHRIADFHNSLNGNISGHVRYVLDATALIRPEEYDDRIKRSQMIARRIGPAAGAVHLRDCVMPPDGETAYPGPGDGKLDYPAYLESIFEHVHPETPAIIRNVPTDQFAEVRNRLLVWSNRWELA